MTLNDKIDEELLNLLIEIENIGFRLCLVGGAVRDFLLSNQTSLGSDLDFEIRSTKRDINWDNEFEKLYQFLLAKKLKIEKLPYQILRINFKGVVLEFSTPRIEKPIDEITGHHHFQAVLDPGLDYSSSFKRRDFSINAIGLKCDFFKNEFELVDPFAGLIDLKNKMLKNITEDFYLDYVRFLRLIRFYSLEYHIDPSIDFHKFNIENISNHYLSYEFNKSNKSIFLDKLISISKELKIKKLNMLANINFKFEKYLIENSVDVLIISLINQVEMDEFVKKINVSEKEIIKIKKIFNLLLKLKNFDINEINIILSLSLEDMAKNENLLDIKNLIDEREKVGFFKKYKLFFKYDLNLFDKIIVSQDDLQKIPPPLRNIEKLRLLLTKWKSNE